jgi:hypothetical protein
MLLKGTTKDYLLIERRVLKDHRMGTIGKRSGWICIICTEMISNGLKVTDLSQTKIRKESLEIKQG